MTAPMTGVVSTELQALRDNAERLGLVWKRRPATIVAPQSDDPTGVTAVMDGDTVPINVYSLIGIPVVGARVMCDIVPPSGIYVVGYVGPTPSNLLGGKLYVTSGAKVAVAAAEVIPNDYTITVTEPPVGHLIRIECSYRVVVTTAMDMEFRIRRTNIAGTRLGQNIQVITNTSYGYQFSLHTEFLSIGGLQTYVFTAAKIAGAGTFSIIVDSSAMANSFYAYDLGPITNITQV